MQQMDLNSDGKITKAEAPDQLKASFQYVDANGDGGIDEAEAQSMADYINKNGQQ
jgi:Ca2+-binding EF-hand superfamily protein